MPDSNNIVDNYLTAPLESIRKRIFAILVSERNTDSTGKLFNFILVTLILLNIIAVIIETIESIYNTYKPYFETLEIYTLTIFTIEYLLQVWICTLKERYRHPFYGRIKFILSPMAIIELLVILPLIISMFSHLDFRIFSIFRLVMVFRILKLEKYAEALRTFKHIILDKKEELIITFFTIIFLLILSSSLMYIVEKDENYDFNSIPATMWWAASTLTTVGYGDVYPVTPAGKFLGSLIAILGIAMFAVPAGLISSSFTEYVQRKREGNHDKKTCPHCKKEIEP